MKQSLSLLEQDIKEFETLEVILKTINEGDIGDLLIHTKMGLRSHFFMKQTLYF